MVATLEKVIKVSLKSSELRRGLKVISKVIGKSPIIPIVENVLVEVKLGVIVLIGTDLNTFVQFEIESETVNYGKFLVDFYLLSQIVKNIPDQEICIESCGEDVQVSWKDASVVLKPDENVMDFPATKLLPDKCEVEFNANKLQLLEGLSLCLKTTSSDVLRPALCGIVFNSNEGYVHLASTDGYKLSRYEMDCKAEFQQFIVSKRVALIFAEISKSTSELVGVKIQGNRVSFSFDSCIIVTKIVEERYPDYGAVFPTESGVNIEMSLDDFLVKLKIAKVLSNSMTHQVALRFSKDSLTINSVDFDYGSASKQTMKTTSASKEKEITMGFNSKFLYEVLSPHKGIVSAKFFAPNKPALLFPKATRSDKFTLLVMPVMLNEYP